MPALYVLGGANCVGKTTWYQNGLRGKAIEPDLPFLNTDMIVLQELGRYTPDNIAKAEQIAKERMRLFLNERKDFLIESNLSKSADYDWIASMRKNGYDTILFFLGTSNVEINKERVKSRVMEGGHDIPDAIIEHRYQAGLSYIKSKLLDFSEATLIDASTDKPHQMAQLLCGSLMYKHPDCPFWVRQSLELVERLMVSQ